MKLSGNFRQELILILKYIIFYWVIYLYTDLTRIAKWNTLQLKMEIPFVIYLYFLFNGILKNDRFKYILAAIPILILYIIHDLYFFAFGQTPRLIEIKQLPELIDVLDVKYLLLLLGLLIPPGILLIKFDRNKLKLFLLRSTPLLTLFLFIIYAPESLTKHIEKIGNIYEYSDIKSVKKTGRIITVIYYEAKRRSAYKQLSNYKDLTKLNFTGKVLHKINNKNVHLLILESFIDPRWFANLKFNINPAHDSFMQLLNNNVGSSYSPVYGGGTAQAEFEILCGVPAFGRFDSVEFNMFTGSKTFCLPEILNEAGYLTIATNAYKPYFNALNAYKGLGFDFIYFPKEYVPNNETYLKLDDTPGGFLFDGSLLRQNFDFISKALHHGKPVLNYVLGIYGHMNFKINEEKRPPLIKTDSAIPEIDRITNQFYERTQAIAEFVNRISLIDPESLIIIVGDHLPPLNLITGKDVYSELGYLNNIPDAIHYTPFIVIKNGKAVKYENFYHFHIYRLIMDYLTNGHYCKEYDCQFNADNKSIYYNDYLTILGLAVR